MYAHRVHPLLPGCFLALWLLTVSTVAGLTLESATYSIKEAPLFGNTYKYAMFEAQFDEDLYLMRQSPCQCVNSSLPCGSSSSKLAPVVNENVNGPNGLPLYFNVLEEDVWFNSSIMNTYDAEYAKFTVNYDASRPCPIIRFEFQQQVGTLTAFISARRIPTGPDADFSHPFQASSTIVICPTQPHFYYGTYYIYLQNQAGRSTNIYGMRYSIINSPTCQAPSTANTTGIPTTAGSTWLQDGVMTSFATVGANSPSHRYYQLYSEGPCANFSAAMYRTSLLDSPTFMFVSPTTINPNSNALNLVKWHALFFDPYINVQYCNPDPQATYNVFYIGINVQATVGSYQLVATTQYQEAISLSSMAYTQSRLDLSYGVAPTLECENAQLQCTYFAFKGCENRPIGCCLHFTPVVPEEHAQSIWPWNAGDNSVGQFHLGINWVDMNPIKPGKLAWSVLLEWSTATTRHITSAIDPAKCNVTLRNNLMSPQGQNLTLPSLSFTKKQVACDYAEYQRLITRMDEYIARYANAKDDVNEVALQQVRVAIASWNDVYDACKNLVLDHFSQLNPVYAQNNAYVCTQRPFTAEWNADPCCNPNLKSTLSCRPTAVNRLLPVSGRFNEKAMDEACANPQCSSSSVQTFLDTSRLVANEENGCLDALNERASVEQATDLLVFTVNCKNKIEGTDLLGARCTSSADCYKGAACNASTGRCAHTANDVLDCMANSISFDTALGLFSVWGMTQKPDNVSLLAAFQSKWLSQQCNGPQAAKYRRGFFYSVNAVGCTDYCLLNDLQPSCVDSSKSRTAACVIPTICDRSVNTSNSVCYRYWQPTIDDEVGCLNEKICNWRRNASYPCPVGRTNSCEADCTAGSPDVCMDCSRDISGSCLEIDTITDAARCSQGLCSTNSTITDPTECALAGTCSARCVGCTQSQCTSTGSCSDYNDFSTLIAAGVTGVCVRPRFWSALANAYTCAAFVNTTLKGWTCAYMDSVTYTQTACSAISGASWMTFGTDEATCASNSGSGCWSTSANMWWNRNQTECAICPDCVWKPHYTWSVGRWTPGRIQPLTWAKRQYYTATSWTTSVNYFQATKDVNAAITRDFAYAYYTDSLCRYDSVNGLVKSVVCDCATEEKTGCFTSRSKAAIGSVSVCPYQTKSIETTVAFAQISDSVVPVSAGCRDIELAMTSVGKYQVPPDHSVTHALFNKVEKNPYLIVVNDKGAVVGQLLSDAATITFDFTPGSPIQLCVFVADFINVDKAASVYALAKVRSDNAIQVFKNGLVYSKQEIEAYAASMNSSRLQVCDFVSESGTYFAVAVTSDYKKLDPRPSAETIAAACIYLCLGVFAIVQAILLIIDRSHQKLLSFKLIALFVIVINVAVRTAYVLLDAGAFKKGMESIAFIVFELPTFLYFSVFTVIVYLWVLVVINTRHFGKRSAMNEYRPIVRSLFIGMNIFMYFIFVIFIFLIAILPQLTKQSPCFLGNLDSAMTSTERTIKMAYWIFQLVISVILAVGFATSTILLLNIIRKLNRRNVGKQGGSESRRATRRANETDIQMIIITVVAFVCVVFLLVRAAIFLDVAVNNSTLHVIVFCLLEVVPQTMLAFYLHPFRCFREAGRRSTTGSSSSKFSTSKGPTAVTNGYSGTSHVSDDNDDDDDEESSYDSTSEVLMSTKKEEKKAQKESKFGSSLSNGKHSDS